MKKQKKLIQVKKYNSLKIKCFAKKLYLRLLHNLIKKGKKHKIESMFKALSLFIVKLRPQKKTWIKYKYKFIILSYIYTRTQMIAKPRRKGSRNLNVPVPISLKRQIYFSSKWLELCSYERLHKSFYKNLAEEIFGSSLKKSLSYIKHKDMRNLVVTNKLNVKRRKRKFLTRRDIIHLNLETRLKKEGRLEKHEKLID